MKGTANAELTLASPSKGKRRTARNGELQVKSATTARTPRLLRTGNGTNGAKDKSGDNSVNSSVKKRRSTKTASQTTYAAGVLGLDDKTNLFGMYEEYKPHEWSKTEKVFAMGVLFAVLMLIVGFTAGKLS